MYNVDTYKTIIPTWASSVEMVADVPFKGEMHEKLIVPDNADFIVAVASLPNGARPAWLDIKMSLRDPKENFYNEPINNDEWFSSEDNDLVVLNSPNHGNWAIELYSTGSAPFAVNFLAFHPLIKPASPPSPGVPFKCRACKTTAKALALAIVAASTLPAIPAAFIATVASFLGVTVVIAAAFIGSVISDTADLVTEKLCKYVGICP